MIYVPLIQLFTALPDIIFVVMLAIVLVGVPWVMMTSRRDMRFSRLPYGFWAFLKGVGTITSPGQKNARNRVGKL